MEASVECIGLGSGSESMKIMAEKHTVIRAHLEEAEADLEDKKIRLKQGKWCLIDMTNDWADLFVF